MSANSQIQAQVRSRTGAHTVRQTAESKPVRQTRWRLCALVLAALTLGACGGGGGSSPAAQIPQPPVTAAPPAEFVANQFEPSQNFRNSCESPRAGNGFNDAQGSAVDENNWLRAWSNELYLWYDEIADANPAEYTTPIYFDLMQTMETTASGNPKDQFHFSINTEEFQALSQSGISVGYGIELALLSTRPPREIIVALTQPNTPATRLDIPLERGTRILEVDGRDAVNGGTQDDVDALNAGLFPASDGETHTFLVEDIAGTQRTITLSAEQTVTVPVQNVRIEDTAAGPVGYMNFTTHIETAETQLIEAIETFEAAGVSELVLDMRYNGGGLLYIANELASMIAGPGAASGRVFEELQFNDKNPGRDPVRNVPLEPDFFAVTSREQGTSNAGRVLPSLNLSRVFVLSGPGTCSASESIINGLRGIDVEVVMIGETTCGKPYGFYPFDNCGTTYFSVQFRGVNAKNFGDYADGFSPANLPIADGEAIPGCAVADDFSKALGDPTEGRFAAALQYIADGSCPSPTLTSGTLPAATFGQQQRLDGDPAAAIRSAPTMPGHVRLFE